jgi:hypothetical protein
MLKTRVAFEFSDFTWLDYVCQMYIVSLKRLLINKEQYSESPAHVLKCNYKVITLVHENQLNSDR